MPLQQEAMKKVLVVSPFFPPFSKAGATKRIENFVRYLPEYQWRPLVMAMYWGETDIARDDRAGMFYTRNIAYASWKAYQSADLEKGTAWKSLILRKIIDFLRRVKKYILIPDEFVLWSLWAIPKAREIMEKEKPSVILVTAPPYSSLLTGVILKKLLKIPLVCDLRDDWVENPLIEKDNRVLRLIERKMERWVANNSDRIIVMTSASMKHWLARYPGLDDKFLLIPNGYNEEEFGCAAEHYFDNFAMVHVGSLELNRSPELIYKALSMLGNARGKIHFYQYGLALRVFHEMAVRYNVENDVHFEGIVESSEAISCIKGASLLVLLPTTNAPTAIPGKAYEYLRTGNPILLISEENATTAFMKEFPQVYHVTPEDHTKCLEVILKIYNEQGSMKKAIYFDNIKQYERKEITKMTAESLDALISR